MGMTSENSLFMPTIKASEQKNLAPRGSVHFLELTRKDKKIAPKNHQEVVNQPNPPLHRLEEVLKHFILNIVENRGKREAKTARDLARKALRRERQSPFTTRIVKSRSPRKFTIPKIPHNDKKSNPVHYVRAYDQTITLWENNKTLMCRCFPASRGRQLSSGTISSLQGPLTVIEA